MLNKLIFIALTLVTGFMTPSIKTDSGNKLTISGRGPPLLFSS